MRSRRIKIEGDRYLIFYTFEDEPWLGPAASGDAGAQQPERRRAADSSPAARQGGADGEARRTANDESDREANDEAGRTTARRRQVSSDGQSVAGADPRGEGRDV